MKIDLASLGIENLRVGKTIAGTLTYEVQGEENVAKADALATKIREILAEGPEIKVARPFKTAEIRLWGIDVATEPEEIIRALATVGECPTSQIHLGEISNSPRGGAGVWAKCPLTAINKIVENGGIKVGWTKAKVEVLENRPLQCHRCHRIGHVRANCRREDRSTCCYRCGQPGHLAKNCGAPRAGCPICKETERPDTHRTGSDACKAPKVGPRAAAIPLDECPRPERTEKTPQAPDPVPRLQRRDRRWILKIREGRGGSKLHPLRTGRRKMPPNVERGQQEWKRGRRRQPYQLWGGEGAEDASVSQRLPTHKE